MGRLILNLLGGFEARLTAEGPPLALPKKTQALIAYLALAPRPVTRVELATLLWGETGRSQAQQSLRQTLSGLRQSLGKQADVLVADAQLVGLERGGFESDAHAFETLAAKADTGSLAQAAAL